MEAMSIFGFYLSGHLNNNLRWYQKKNLNYFLLYYHHTHFIGLK